MSFTVQRLAGDRALISGNDINGYEGRTVISTYEYDRITEDTAHDQAHAEFDAAIEAFYAPLTEAAGRLEATHHADSDPLFTHVVQEAVEAVAGRDEIRVHLNKDTVILRLIDAGETDRLIWVRDELEILEKVSAPSTIQFADGTAPGLQPF